MAPAIPTCQRACAMNAHVGVTAVARCADLDRPTPGWPKSPQLCRGAMAERGTRAAREHCGHCPSVRRDGTMTDRIDLPMDPVQTPDLDAVADGGRAETGFQQLSVGQQAMLRSGALTQAVIHRRLAGRVAARIPRVPPKGCAMWSITIWVFIAHPWQDRGDGSRRGRRKRVSSHSGGNPAPRPAAARHDPPPPATTRRRAPRPAARRARPANGPRTRPPPPHRSPQRSIVPGDGELFTARAQSATGHGAAGKGAARWLQAQ